MSSDSCPFLNCNHFQRVKYFPLLRNSAEPALRRSSQFSYTCTTIIVITILYVSCLNPSFALMPFLCITTPSSKKIASVKQTMAKRTGSFIVVLMLASKNLISCTDVSSQISFDSHENGKNIKDLNGISGQEVDSRFYKLFDEFAISNGMKRRSQITDSARQPTVINNVRIIVNDNGTQSDVDKCKNEICNVSVSSKGDDEGNIVTDVHLKIVTKLINPKTIDIPIVDGVRGVEKIIDLQRSRPTDLHNIPQIQSRYEGGEPWYQGGRTFQLRPPIRPVVDDKIEPPLSKT